MPQPVGVVARREFVAAALISLMLIRRPRRSPTAIALQACELAQAIMDEYARRGWPLDE